MIDAASSADTDDYETRQLKQSMYDVLHYGPTSALLAAARSQSLTRTYMDMLKAVLASTPPSQPPSQSDQQQPQSQPLSDAPQEAHGNPATE
ncbi:hypothetical protein BC831DRAFT_513878 [Entophlyctis helioformis]|nr:hypothetical protein BC831DRAFT_513878 [Entophlyctis helioformis]